MATIWEWLAAENGRDTNNNDLRTALQNQGYDDQSELADMFHAFSLLEPRLVGAPGVTVAMVGGLFAEAAAQRMFFVFLFFLVFCLALFRKTKK